MLYRIPSRYFQLVFGALISFVFFAMMLRATPYTALSEDLLAVACQAALLLNIGLAILQAASRDSFAHALLTAAGHEAEVKLVADAQEVYASEQYNLAVGLFLTCITPCVLLVRRPFSWRTAPLLCTPSLDGRCSSSLTTSCSSGASRPPRRRAVATRCCGA